jgi:hypothetical protein
VINIGHGYFIIKTFCRGWQEEFLPDSRQARPWLLKIRKPVAYSFFMAHRVSYNIIVFTDRILAPKRAAEVILCSGTLL